MNLTDLTDEQLMAHISNRNHEALSVLYDRYASSIMGLALRMLRNRQTAEEVVQETFWRVWEQASSFDGRRGTFKSWLFSIARRYAIDLTRRAKVRPDSASSQAEAEMMLKAPSDENVVEAVIITIEQERVKEALANLPPDQLEVIQLSYYQGLTRREIADVTDTPVGTIHTRARLALQKLAAQLRGEGPRT